MKSNYYENKILEKKMQTTTKKYLKLWCPKNSKGNYEASCHMSFKVTRPSYS